MAAVTGVSHSPRSAIHPGVHLSRSQRVTLGVVAGGLTAVAIGLGAATIARQLWPAYAAAEPRRAYTLVMLISRLTAGACITSVAAIVAMRVANDTERAAWWLGALFLSISLPHHVLNVWAEYPVWYHLVYLGYLVPVAGLTGRLVGSNQVRGAGSLK